MMIDPKEAKEANIRLVILRAIGEDQDETLNATVLQVELERFGYRRSRDFIANQLAWMEREAGAVTLTHAGSEVIAFLAEPGRDHLARRRALVGIQRPSNSVL